MDLSYGFQKLDDQSSERSRSYRQFVGNQMLRNPSLSALYGFLTSSKPERQSCRISSINFLDERSPPTYEFLKPEELVDAIQPSGIIPRSYGYGKIIIIEDLTRDVIGELGDHLNIDPLFFASHLYAAFGLTSSRAPPHSTLPSRKKRQNFANIVYHRVLQINSTVPNARKLLRNMNVARKTTLPTVKNIQFAVVQHVYSVWRTVFEDGSWLCVMLVDPPLSAWPEFVLPGDGCQNALALAAHLFQDGYEDFTIPTFESSFTRNETPRFQHGLGMFEDLITYWIHQVPQNFDWERPTIVQLSQYALSIIAAEWVNYETLVNITAKDLEYAIPNSPDLSFELEKLSSNLKSLQSWLRRSGATRAKIRSVIDLIKSEKREGEPWESLLKDYQYLLASFQPYGTRLENMQSMVAFFVQIIDKRRSLEETANITKLTYLALIFAPLTYVTGLFSMNPDIAPSGPYFWVYFVVAVPLALLVFFIARPPVLEVPLLVGWLR